MLNPRTGLADRLLALAGYAGCAPAQWLFAGEAPTFFAAHHRRLALALWFVFALITLIFVLTVLGLSYTLVNARALYEGRHLEFYLLGFTRKLYICWAVCWAYCVLLALAGATWHLPLFSWLAGLRIVCTSTAVSMCCAAIMLLALLPFAAHSALIARQDPAPGKVYMLYEDLDFFPRPIFTFGFYRIALEATARCGPDAVVALKLTPESIHRAVREAEFIFIGSHGARRGLMLKDTWFRPEDIDPATVNPGLRYVYLTGCDSGVQRAAWEKALAPAQVVTFERLTAVLEHAWWLWLRGPDVIRTLYPLSIEGASP
ncbi:MAG: hypothetical protein HYV27_16530 [Candidatus Hydrogenedentes bacterium]|nr:hypothetical protein [Candidatus Hydrogenedentota bacterium]